MTDNEIIVLLSEFIECIQTAPDELGKEGNSFKKFDEKDRVKIRGVYRLCKNHNFSLAMAKGSLDIYRAFLLANTSFEDVHRELILNPSTPAIVGNMLKVLYPNLVPAEEKADCGVNVEIEIADEVSTEVVSEEESKSDAKRRLSEEEKREIVAQYKSSGLSMTDFAKGKNIGYQNLRNWISKFG